MGRFEVDTHVPGVAFVALAGEHELYGATKLQEEVDALIAAGRSIVIDLSETVFVDSTIVGVLLKARQLAASKGVEYRIVLSEGTGEPVRRMFALTGLDDLLPIVERDDALPPLH